MADDVDVAFVEQEAAWLVEELVCGLVRSQAGRLQMASVLEWDADAWPGPRGEIMRMAAALLKSG